MPAVTALPTWQGRRFTSHTEVGSAGAPLRRGCDVVRHGDGTVRQSGRMGWVEVVFVDAGRVRQHRRSDIDNRTRQLLSGATSVEDTRVTFREDEVVPVDGEPGRLWRPVSPPMLLRAASRSVGPRRERRPLLDRCKPSLCLGTSGERGRRCGPSRARTAITNAVDGCGCAPSISGAGAHRCDDALAAFGAAPPTPVDPTVAEHNASRYYLGR